MKYTVNTKLKDPIILSELLQNRFTKFDDSVVKWKFRDSNINSAILEKKLINNYQNKKKNIYSIKDKIYSDWIDIFDDGLKKILKSNHFRESIEDEIIPQIKSNNLYDFKNIIAIWKNVDKSSSSELE